jgi:hypothetical protein
MHWHGAETAYKNLLALRAQQGGRLVYKSILYSDALREAYESAFAVHLVDVDMRESAGHVFGNVDIPGTRFETMQSVSYNDITRLIFTVLKQEARWAFRVHIVLGDRFAIRFTGARIWAYRESGQHVAIKIPEFVEWMSSEPHWENTHAQVSLLEDGEPVIVLFTSRATFLLKCVVSKSFIDIEFDPNRPGTREVEQRVLVRNARSHGGGNHQGPPAV